MKHFSALQNRILCELVAGYNRHTAYEAKTEDSREKMQAAVDLDLEMLWDMTQGGG